MVTFLGVNSPLTEPPNGVEVEDFRGYKLSNSRDSSLMKEPLRLKGVLGGFKSVDVTPVIGTEFPEDKVTDWMRATNSEELLRDLAITSKFII